MGVVVVVLLLLLLLQSSCCCCCRKKMWIVRSAIFLCMCLWTLNILSTRKWSVHVQPPLWWACPCGNALFRLIHTQTCIKIEAVCMHGVRAIFKFNLYDNKLHCSSYWPWCKQPHIIIFSYVKFIKSIRLNDGKMNTKSCEPQFLQMNVCPIKMGGRGIDKHSAKLPHAVLCFLHNYELTRWQHCCYVLPPASVITAF